MLAPGPPLKFKLNLLARSGGLRMLLFPYLPNPSHRNASEGFRFSVLLR
jgi:hypothetical protein